MTDKCSNQQRNDLFLLQVNDDYLITGRKTMRPQHSERDIFSLLCGLMSSSTQSPCEPVARGLTNGMNTGMLIFL